MGEFSRSYSRVWWQNEWSSARADSSSPSSHRSQDSGFSDSEAAPGSPAQQRLHSSEVASGSPAPQRPHASESLQDVSDKEVVPENATQQSLHRSEGVLNREEVPESPTPQPPQCLDLTELPGPPTHTSTPKGSSAEHEVKRSARFVSLIHDFTRDDTNSQPVGRSPVQQWLTELGVLYEPECMTTLQSKSLASDLGRQVAAMAATTTDTIRMLQDRTRLISVEFSKLCRKLERGSMEHVAPLVQSLAGHIGEFLQDVGPSQQGDMAWVNMERRLAGACDRLRLTAAQPQHDALAVDVTSVGHKFTRVVDYLMGQHITVLVGVLEEPGCEVALRSALCSITTLGLEGPHLSRLVAQHGGVRALLAVCIDTTVSSVRTAALRALATVCCVSDNIRQLEQAGGVEILADLLGDNTRPELELSEAAAVLAQITAPWVEDNHSVKGLSEHLATLVPALTRLASNTECSETLLLAAAALANITFMEPRAVWPLLECETAGQLLRAVRRRGPCVSVFLQEQAATLLANMAAVPECRGHLAQHRAVVALLCFLQIRHSPLERAPEISAAERVQQKSAIALSRLCSDPVVANQVVELQGVGRLVRLCKEKRERNHSDGVLVACLAALRKIAANCGTKVIEDLDAMELVEPRLLDSFLIYSSRQESYV